MKRILIAGIGNIFYGDDAFGVEVVRRIRMGTVPEGVYPVDFGARSYELAFSLSDGYDAIVFVDATPRGGKPGTLYLLKLNPGSFSTRDPIMNGHSLDLGAVLQMVPTLEAEVGKLYLVGCEPAALETEEGRIGLSAEVSAAIGQALGMIFSLVQDIQEGDSQSNQGRDLIAA